VIYEALTWKGNRAKVLFGGKRRRGRKIPSLRLDFLSFRILDFEAWNKTGEFRK